MAERPTTFDLTAILRRMGVRGGRQPALADVPLQPSIVVADFSRSQAPEAVEARAVCSFEATTWQGNPGVFYFWSLAPGGCVIEGLDVTLNSLGLAAPSAYTTHSDPFQGAPESGSWFVGRSTYSPEEVFSGRISGFAQLAGPPAPNPFIDTPRFDIGGLPSVSRVFQPDYPNTTTYFVPWTVLPPPLPQLGDPLEWSSDGSPNHRSPDIILPPSFSLAADVRWYVAPGTGIYFGNTAYWTTPGGPFLRFTVQMRWREVPVALGSP